MITDECECVNDLRELGWTTAGWISAGEHLGLFRNVSQCRKSEYNWYSINIWVHTFYVSNWSENGYGHDK